MAGAGAPAPPPEETYTIGGVTVKFPFKAYPSQISMMDKIIRALQTSKHAIIESPTGSGKSLSLLCASLAWLRAENQKHKDRVAAIAERAKEEAIAKLAAQQRIALLQQQQQQQQQQQAPAPAISLNEFEYGGRTGATPAPPAAPPVDADNDDDDFQPAKPRHAATQPSQVGGKGATPPVPSSQYPSVDPRLLRMDPVFVAAIANAAARAAVENDAECGSRFRPRIYFGTRTHKQIAQIIRELRRTTTYRECRMAILSSREHTCVNSTVARSANRNEECKDLIEVSGCHYYNNVDRMKVHRDLMPGGALAIWDIEDMVALGVRERACPYFTARELAEDADIVFCPYNYLIDPQIRQQMSISLKENIVILDEAHNIEDAAREAASFEANYGSVLEAIQDINRVIEHEALPASLRPHHIQLRAVLMAIADVIRSEPQSMAGVEYEKMRKIWTGPEAAATLAIHSLDEDNVKKLLDVLHDLQERMSKMFEKRSKADFVPKMAGPTSQLLTGLLLVLDMLLGKSGRHMGDYRMVLLKAAETVAPRSRRNPQREREKEWTLTLAFWCLNPAVAFEAIGGSARSVVLTSGTLSPMGSFASELGCEFPIRLEAAHVVDPSRVFVGVLGFGPGGHSLNASFKNAETFTFQDEVGAALLSICQRVPNGVLCFFPSYSMLDRISQRWKNTGLWTEISRFKAVFDERRNADKGDFERALKEFYECVPTGALLLAVCRGKVSEGLDFADANARAVVTVGIPFPNIKDTQVELKREYNDSLSRTRGLLTGAEWYEIQAFRAINQALGRCIRHRNDWGAILMIEERFRNVKYQNSLSKWVRTKIVAYDRFDAAMDSLDGFIRRRTEADDALSTASSAPAPPMIAPVAPVAPAVPRDNVQPKGDIVRDAAKEAVRHVQTLHSFFRAATPAGSALAPTPAAAPETAPQRDMWPSPPAVAVQPPPAPAPAVTAQAASTTLETSASVPLQPANSYRSPTDSEIENPYRKKRRAVEVTAEADDPPTREASPVPMEMALPRTPSHAVGVLSTVDSPQLFDPAPVLNHGGQKESTGRRPIEIGYESAAEATVPRPHLHVDGLAGGLVGDVGAYRGVVGCAQCGRAFARCLAAAPKAVHRLSVFGDLVARHSASQQQRADWDGDGPLFAWVTPVEHVFEGGVFVRHEGLTAAGPLVPNATWVAEDRACVIPLTCPVCPGERVLGLYFAAIASVSRFKDAEGAVWIIPAAVSFIERDQPIPTNERVSQPTPKRRRVTRGRESGAERQLTRVFDER